MKTNPYETRRDEQIAGRTNMRRKPNKWAHSGAWIGLLAVVIAIAIAVWMLRRVPALPPAALLFVGFTVFPYLIVGVFSCFVTNLPAKALLFFALIALVITTYWQFSIRDAQAAMMMLFQFPRNSKGPTCTERSARSIAVTVR